MATTEKLLYAASATLTYTSLASLASSSSLVAGAESALIDNTSTLYDEIYIGMTIKMGASTPTANTSIEVWIIPTLNDTPTWPDVFDGTDSAETVGGRDLLFGYGRLVKVFNVIATADLLYQCTIPVAATLGFVPLKFGVFVTQNSGQALAASGSSAKYTGIHYQSV